MVTLALYFMHRLIEQPVDHDVYVLTYIHGVYLFRSGICTASTSPIIQTYGEFLLITDLKAIRKGRTSLSVDMWR